MDLLSYPRLLSAIVFCTVGDDLSILKMPYGLCWYLLQTFIMTDFLLQQQINNAFNAVGISLCQQMTSICFKTPKIDLPREEE